MSYAQSENKKIRKKKILELCLLGLDSRQVWNQLCKDGFSVAYCTVLGDIRQLRQNQNLPATVRQQRIILTVEWLLQDHNLVAKQLQERWNTSYANSHKILTIARKNANII